MKKIIFAASILAINIFASAFVAQASIVQSPPVMSATDSSETENDPELISKPRADENGQVVLTQRGTVWRKAVEEIFDGAFFDIEFKLQAKPGGSMPGDPVAWYYDIEALDCKPDESSPHTHLRCNMKVPGPTTISANGSNSITISVPNDRDRPPAPDIGFTKAGRVSIVNKNGVPVFRLPATIKNNSAYRVQAIPVNMVCETEEAGVGTYGFAARKNPLKLAPRRAKRKVFRAPLASYYSGKIKDFKRTKQKLACNLYIDNFFMQEFEYSQDADQSNNTWRVEFQWNGRRWKVLSSSSITLPVP